MPFVPGPWPPTLAVVVATVALAGCTRFGFRHPVESDDTAADAQRPDSHDVPADTASGVDAPDAITCDGAAVEGGVAPADLTTPPANLRGAWLMDEGGGQTVSGGPGSAGFLGTGNVADSADPIWEKTAARVCRGTGLTFDGGDDVVTIPGASPSGLSKFTIAFSVHVAGNGGGGLPRILTKENGGASDTLVHYRAMDKAIAVNMFNTADTLFATFAAGVVPGQRASWALTYDDGGDRRLHAYKNGKETTYTRQDALSGTMRTTQNPWRIGNEATGVRGFDGTIDEVRVYDRVLSLAEIAALSSLCPP
jgi:hypothetical protein